MTSGLGARDSVLGELLPHPAAEIFPLLAGEEYAAFKADIAERGLIEPIWLHEGKILDGRNRYRACRELGITARFRDYTGNSPVAFVWSLNGARRHLEKSQLAMLAVKMLGPLKEEAKKRQLSQLTHVKDSIVPPETVERASGEAVKQAAKIVGVGKNIVQEAKAVAERAPELVPHVEAGKLTVSKAHKMMQQTTASTRVPQHQRAAEIKQLATEGHRAEQIADALGIGVERVREVAKTHAIKLPDAQIGKAHKINARRVIEETINGLSGYVIGLQTINGAIRTVEPVHAKEWAASLTESLRVLTRLRKQLLEVANG